MKNTQDKNFSNDNDVGQVRTDLKSFSKSSPIIEREMFRAKAESKANRKKQQQLNKNFLFDVKM